MKLLAKPPADEKCPLQIPRNIPANPGRTRVRRAQELARNRVFIPRLFLYALE